MQVGPVLHSCATFSNVVRLHVHYRTACGTRDIWLGILDNWHTKEGEKAEPIIEVGRQWLKYMKPDYTY